ncbi:hypothetical protein B0H34DRAFT_723654, partial [Crassisporium funariophilum]
MSGARLPMPASACREPANLKMEQCACQRSGCSVHACRSSNPSCLPTSLPKCLPLSPSFLPAHEPSNEPATTPVNMPANMPANAPVRLALQNARHFCFAPANYHRGCNNACNNARHRAYDARAPLPPPYYSPGPFAAIDIVVPP